MECHIRRVVVRSTSFGSSTQVRVGNLVVDGIDELLFEVGSGNDSV